jgi:hypothetical protein
MSIVMLWMGIGSTYFTRRTAAASQTVIDQVEPQRPYETRTPVGSGVRVQAAVGRTSNSHNAAEIPAAEIPAEEGANR